MKWRLPFGSIGLCMLLTFWAGAAPAVSKYTDKENALNLAETLDKGIFRNRLITATFVQSVGKGRYFVKVVLDNGAEHNWTLKRIRTFSKQEAIVLSGNRALLFLSENSNDFATLDKTQFTHLALSAGVYVKRYKPHDVLAGKKIAFGISRFNLTHLLGLKTGRDDSGYAYHYVLDLENGQREFLSYLDAYYTLNENGFSAVGPVMHFPYKVQKIEPIALRPLGPSGMGKFGVELIFDRSIDLDAGHFPFRFFENGGGTPKFLVEVTAPNAVLGGSVKTIRSLEFLRNVRVIPDTRNPVRVVMRAAVTPDVINFPPEVEVNGDTVRISFTKVMDQSVYDRRTLARKALRVKQDRLLHSNLLPDQIEMRKRYRGFMESGNKNMHTARRSRDFQERFQAYKGAMEDFRNAASNATTDLSLDHALRARNLVTKKLPEMVIRHVRAQLMRGESASGMSSALEYAAKIAQDKKLARVLNGLMNRVK